MTGELFLTLLNRSITAGWLVLAVLVLRLLFRRAPKAFFAALWVLVGIRLLCPFSFESRFSLLRTAEPVPQELFSSGSLFPAGKETLPGDSGILTENVPDVKEPDAPGKTDREQGKPEHREENAVGADGSSAAEQDNNTMRSVSVLAVASAVWLAGMAGMLFYGGISCWRISRRVRESVPLAGNVRLCDRIGSPFILGVFRPRIYLPSDLNETDRVYVLAHETAHLKRCDHIWKPLGFLLLSVYWFHPLLWLSYLLLCRDIELACDERVVKELGEESKKSYSTALINCSIPRRMLTACPLAFGEVSVKRRIKSVLNYKKPAFWIVIAAAVAFLGVGIAFCTNPKEKKEYPVENPDEAGNDRDEGKLTESGKSDNDIIDWKDSALETAMRRATGITDRPVTWGDVKHITELNLSNAGIADISALAELTGLTKLNLSYNKLTDISALTGLSRLTTLNLAGNKASYFRKFALSDLEGLDNLVNLDLSFNGITDISTLPALKSLTVLNLSGNGLTSVESLKTSSFPALTTLDVSQNKFISAGAIWRLCNLTSLDISHNNLADTDGLSELQKLTTLDLSNNTNIELKNMSGFKSLISLNLSGCNIADFSSLSKCKALTTLKLSGSSITDISCLSKCKKLTKLILWGTRELDINSLSKLTNIRELELSHNCLTDISVLSGLTNLTSLTLMYDELTDISVLSKLTKLEYLNLYGNQLTDISALSKLTKLECLNLCGNQLADVSSLSGLTNLTELYLMENALEDIRFLAGLTRLTELSLCDNRLTNIESLSELKNLTVLLLAGNRLTDISALSGLTKLTWLSLSDNEITNVDSLSGLTKLTTLALERNRIEDVSALSGLTHTSKWLDGNDIKVWEKSPELTGTPEPPPSGMAFIPSGTGGCVTFTGNTVEIPKAQIGDTVRFGSYEQDNDTSNGAETIEWLVLDKKDGKLLLLSKYVLDAKPYNEEWVSVTWETCTLRGWLNGTFYTTAFSTVEQGRIATTKVRNEDNPKYGTKGGNDTEDKIFLLSIGEATRYFEPDPDVCDPARCVKVTAYAKAQRVHLSSTGNAGWWLRSPGDVATYAADVGYDGNLFMPGDVVSDIYDGYGGVRPAFWLNLES